MWCECPNCKKILDTSIVNKRTKKFFGDDIIPVEEYKYEKKHDQYIHASYVCSECGFIFDGDDVDVEKTTSEQFDKQLENYKETHKVLR